MSQPISEQEAAQRLDWRIHEACCDMNLAQVIRGFENGFFGVQVEAQQGANVAMALSSVMIARAVIAGLQAELTTLRAQVEAQRQGESLSPAQEAQVRAIVLKILSE